MRERFPRLNGGFMNVKELIEVLAVYPEGIDVVVLGRTEAKIGLLVEDSTGLKRGWRASNENSMQRKKGWKRICWTAKAQEEDAKR